MDSTDLQGGFHGSELVSSLHLLAVLGRGLCPVALSFYPSRPQDAAAALCFRCSLDRVHKWERDSFFIREEVLSPKLQIPWARMGRHCGAAGPARSKEEGLAEESSP